MDRIERIKHRLFEKDYLTKKDWWGENLTILTDEEVKKKPLIIRKSLAVQYVARNMPIELKPDELIVGIPTMASVGFGKCFPGYALPEEIEEGARYTYTEKSIFGHHPANYNKILTMGLSGIREEVYSSIQKADHLQDREAIDFYTSVIIRLNAVAELAQRYSILLMEEANTCDSQERKQELMDMSRICSRVPELPATTFHEALQSVWMVFVLFHSTMEFLPIARADQYLYPYLKKDLEMERISIDQARELLGSWLAKFSERVQLDPKQWEMHMTEKDTQFNGADPKSFAASDGYANDEDYNYGTSANHWLINMILGGLTPDGKDATNPLTYMILEEWSFLEAIVPVMSVRFHKDTPQKLYDLCADILRRGSGEPVLYNDDAIIPGLIRIGIPLEDARDYSNDGCWETLIPGKTNFGFCTLEILQLLEYILQDGYSIVRNRKEWNCVNLKELHTFEEFYNEFLKQLEIAAVREMENRMRNIKARYKIAPSPLLSAFMDDCILRGKEYSDTGAVYQIFAFMLTGFASCVDSLAVIKKCVYEDQLLGLEELAFVLKTNFKGQEPLRQKLLNRVPKFGNDEAYVDDIACQLLDDYAAIIDRLREKAPVGNIFACGIATFEFYAKFGHDVGASADGRFAQEPLGSNYSPSIGMDMTGPTAAIKSVTYPNLLPYAIGAPLDLQIDPNEVKGEQGLKRLTGLIKSFMELNGLMLTITGVNQEMMLKAQKEPMKYKSLRVRLGGLSAYFISLSKEVQDSLIKRTKHTL